ncbi:hypothetical protein HZH68_009104 [Vespula germanica]|uniref:Uncharacterized protein n=1 Tax=Vespula germanica TaxID=30212 RepID=A0A834K0L3_VESGE|nr:hypothetical protein HZH68_009104 [Vespula germanica]
MDGYEYDEEVHSVLETFAKRNNDSGDRKLSGLVADALATPGRSCSPIGDYKPAHGYWGAPRVVVRGGAMPIGGLQPAIRGGRYAATHRATAEENNGGILVQEVKRKEGGSRRGNEEAKEEKGRSFYLGPGSSGKGASALLFYAPR